jgi:hypothetical protein
MACAQISQAPGADPIARRLRSAQDVRLQCRLLIKGELLRVTESQSVVETARFFGTGALRRTMQGLALHAGHWVAPV